MTPPPTSSTPRSEFWRGAWATIPLEIGALPFGIIFGALSINSGISPAGTLALSAFVFAGSAQFIAVGLVAGGAAPVLIILTTFIVNLRHALYGAALAPYVRTLPQRWLIPLGFMLTDENFVIAMQRYQQDDDSPYKHWYFLGSEVAMYFTWQTFTLIGIVAGGTIPNIADLGLDFALVVTFIGMTIPQVKDRAALAAVVVGGLTAVLAQPLPNQLWLIVAALAGVIAGMVVETLNKTPKLPETEHSEGMPA